MNELEMIRRKQQKENLLKQARILIVKLNKKACCC